MKKLRNLIAIIALTGSMGLCASCQASDYSKGWLVDAKAIRVYWASTYDEFSWAKSDMGSVSWFGYKTEGTSAIEIKQICETTENSKIISTTYVYKYTGQPWRIFYK